MKQIKLKQFNSVPFITFFRGLEERNEPDITFDQALSVVGFICMGDVESAEEKLMEMDTSPREFLIDTLVEAGLTRGM